MDLPTGLISRSNVVLLANVMVTVVIYSKSVRDLVQQSLCFLRDPQALSSPPFIQDATASGLWVS